MGIFSKITKTAKAIGSNPFKAGNYADLALQMGTAGQVDTKGINTSAVGGKDYSFSDALFGKKAKDINPDAIADQIRETQSKGIGELNAALDTPAEQIVGAQIEGQKQGILTSAQDARRNAQKLMAQRGLSGSSLGLSSQRSIDQQAGNDIASVNASMPGLIRNQKLQDASARINVGGINQNGMNFNTIEGQRSGGLLGIASALAPIASGAGSAMSGYAKLKAVGG